MNTEYMLADQINQFLKELNRISKKQTLPGSSPEAM